jgi:pSer/pThr/pTyr-binding forkhead associated (FHA) protein
VEATKVITCQKCGKENQDHYKFCLGCGAELAREVAQKPYGRGAQAADATAGYADKSYVEKGYAERGTDVPPETAAAPLVGGGTEATHASPGIPAARPRAAEPAPAQFSSPGPNGAAAYIACPQCDHNNPAANRFCASCGYKLNLSSVPVKGGGAGASPAVSGTIRLTALRADGSEAGSYTLGQSPTETIGRDTGSIFAGDSYLSPRHAVFSRKGDRLYVSDARSLNGVYLKIRPNSPWPLRFGDIFRIGQEILRLERLELPQPSPDGVQRLGSPADGYVARLGLVIGRDTTGNAFPVPKTGLHLGRERGDVLFPEDGYVSGLHCRLGVGTDSSITLTDLGSSNGSFVRLKDEHPVSSGDILLMGQQLFRIDA